VIGRTVNVTVPMAETTLENLVKIMPGATLEQVGGVKATGTITVTTQPAANDTVTVNGVAYTFKTAGPLGPRDVLIGATPAETAANLCQKLEASVDNKVVQATYTVETNTITVTYDRYGTIGNKFTLAKTGSGITLSGATLTGGVDPTSARVNVTNGVGMSLLSMAKVLNLHPKGLPDTDRSEDFTVPLAMTSGALQFAYKLDEERIFNVVFKGYPDPLTQTLFIVGEP